MEHSCKNCKNRTINCHATCKEYAEFVKENEKKKHVKREYYAARNVIYHSIRRK